MYSTFERILNSIFRSIQLSFIHLGRPMLITFGFLVIVFLVMLIKYKKDIKQHLNKEIIIKLIKYSLTVLYIGFLLEITLLQRIGIPQQEPLSELWSGWSIFDTDMKMYISFSPIINILMMMPMALITKYVIKVNNKYILKTIILSFVASLVIELCQVIFHLGTFQISDLVYNTIGGGIGMMILLLIEKRVTKKTV